LPVQGVIIVHIYKIEKMKKLFLLAVMFTAIYAKSVSAQEAANTDLAHALSVYYDIKDALVLGNASTASAKAGEFVKILTGIDVKIVGEANRDALLKDATIISNSKDIKDQRVKFADFSENMIALAKTVKLSAMPVYHQYCPMKKASWLSSQQAIKNPYYGSAMLTCGSIKATL
jgi:DNA-binding transcriptional regulator WhiA